MEPVHHESDVDEMGDEKSAVELHTNVITINEERGSHDSTWRRFQQ